MIADIIATLGGVGLFLLGMIWMTEGLRGLAGRRLRSLLARFTRTPLSGAIAGSVTTAVIQSSSATTVTAIGFVSAGLLTFPQAIGIVFGANIGTTFTGWLVAILGFKLNLGDIVLPVVFVGALMRLFGRGLFPEIGMALAGFSLLFIGIDYMQAGMAGFEGVVTPTDFPGDSLIGRLELVLIGVAITIVTQSSSAGIAAALAALGAGAINFPQAAAMVIGMNVGTTVTAVLATLGGSVSARRTALSHVIFNLLTGIMAFFLLSPFTTLAAPMIAGGDEQIGLVAFHTGFNVLGLLLILPFARPFARLVIALVPQRGPHLTRRLDQGLQSDVDAAADAVAGTVEEITKEQFDILARQIRNSLGHRAAKAQPAHIAEALSETRNYVESITPGPLGSPRSIKLATALHVLDHLDRLYLRTNQTTRLKPFRKDPRLRRLSGLLCELASEAVTSEITTETEIRLNRLRHILRSQREKYRERLLLLATTGQLDVSAVPQMLDALRWLHRVAYHLWRIEHHLVRLRDAEIRPPTLAEAEIEAAADL